MKKFLMMAAVVLFVAGCTAPDPEIEINNPAVQSSEPSDNTEPSETPDPGNDNTDPGNDNTDPGNDNTDPGNEETTPSGLEALLVGEWQKSYYEEDWMYPMYVFNDDGTYTVKDIEWDYDGNMSEVESHGTWTVDEDSKVLTLKSQGGEEQTFDAVVIGGGAWLVLGGEESDEGWNYRWVQNYHKVGQETVSGPLADGRWDAPFDGVVPEEYDRGVDYRMVLLVSGNTVDLYVPVWGRHIQGTFTLENGFLNIETDAEHIWQACWGRRAEEGDGGFIGWNASGAPSEEFEDTWDYSYNTIDAETFVPQWPYQWLSVAELKAMGTEPDGDYHYTYEELVWDFAQNVLEESLEMCRFDFCVNDEGTEAYSSIVGLDLWLYRR